MKLLINIDVPDLAAGIDFYCRALELSFTRIIDGDVAELSGAACMLYLLQKSSGTDAATASNMQRQYSRHWTPVHLDFVVQDINAALERALHAGARQESACIEWMGSRCITFSDPFGHGFCLIELTGDSYSHEEHDHLPAE